MRNTPINFSFMWFYLNKGVYNSFCEKKLPFLVLSKINIAELHVTQKSIEGIIKFLWMFSNWNLELACVEYYWFDHFFIFQGFDWGCLSPLPYCFLAFSSMGFVIRWFYNNFIEFLFVHTAINISNIFQMTVKYWWFLNNKGEYNLDIFAFSAKELLNPILFFQNLWGF